MSAWNPDALIKFNKLPSSVKYDLINHVSHDETNQRYFANLDIQVDGFGEAFVTFAGYKISVKRVRISESDTTYRAHF